MLLKSYLLSAYQTFIRQRFFAVINVIGLAIGFCVFTLTSLYVNSEYSFDTHWKNADNIYLLTTKVTLSSQLSFKNIVQPYVAMSRLREYFPDEIESSARRLSRGDYILVGESRFEGGMNLIEKDFITIFNLNEIAGSLQNTLANPGNVALSLELAQRYFGTESALGKTISLHVEDVGLVDYQVSAIYTLPEGSTTLTLPSFALLDASGLTEEADKLTLWNGGLFVSNYFLLKPGVNVDLLKPQLDAFVNQYVVAYMGMENEGTQASDVNQYEFQAFKNIHFDDEMQFDQAGNKDKIIIFAFIGMLVLMIGSINFVILATARSEERRREVGVRKVLGANRKQLLTQFLGESVLLCLIALILALVVVALFSPFFSALIARGLPMSVFSLSSIGFMLMVAITVGIVGGLYPAYVLASFDAVKIFKPYAKRPFLAALNLRSVLVTLQFAIAVMLIIATLVLYLQLSFYKNRDLGFTAENLLAIPLFTEEQRQNVKPLVNELRQLSEVEQVGLASMAPNRSGPSSFGFDSYTKDKSNDNEVDFISIMIGYNFFSIMELPIVSGRSFDSLFDPFPVPRDLGQVQTEQPRATTKLVINRFLSDALGFASPADAVGQFIYQKSTNLDGTTYYPSEVIGVVENSHYQSLRQNPTGEAYTIQENNLSNVLLRFQTSSQDSIREKVEVVWNEIMGEVPLNLNFVDQLQTLEFTQEANEGKILLVFSVLAIFVSSIGLYGLAAYTIKSTSKEIGVRKVLGADFKSVLGLFIWRFIKPVLVANIVASPIILWAILKWLQRFQDQIDYSLLLPVFLLAAIITLIIAGVTVASSTTKAAMADPVESLRYE